ncbi:MAG TPA: S53 family peptidase [Humisphaera sp.]|jgi:subtilase family serine protease|nr:S53 family peptidase [Humisphaera sp.]
MFIESLEPRRLLSASALPRLVHHRDQTFDPSDGFTPAQTIKAYGFTGINFGGIAGDGSGQTIAIVDAYDDAKIVEDLAVFDAQFSLPAPPSFQKVNQIGGTNLPKSNAAWASEIALDVEWAHAIAPQANILLVEARSGSETNLVAAANYAASAPGVSVVSMSWGFNESKRQLTLDGELAAPAGHPGVTFVAAGGDSGPAAGAGWPAVSPQVLSVGGTSLTLKDQSGTYGHEISWDSTGGGYSTMEPQPQWQLGAQSTGARSAPDVSYDADPNTAFAVYDSIPYQDTTGWQQIGGNSAGTPQWAALIAIADQGRALAGRASLDGVTQTLPALYGLYSAPGTGGYANYTTFFNDVKDAANATDVQAVAGYDTATGLGTPHAANIINALVGVTTSQTPPTPPITQFSATFSSIMPIGVISAHHSSATISLRSLAGALALGTANVTLYASTDLSLDSSDMLLTTLDTKTIRLAVHHRKQLKLRFTAPGAQQGGTYYLIASVTFTPSAGGAATTLTAVVGTTAD